MGMLMQSTGLGENLLFLSFPFKYIYILETILVQTIPEGNTAISC